MNFPSLAITFSKTLLWSVPWMIPGAMGGIAVQLRRNELIGGLTGASVFAVICAAQHYSLASDDSAKLGAATAGLLLATGSGYLVERIHLEQAEANPKTITLKEVYVRRVITGVLTALGSQFFGKDLTLTACLTGLSLVGSRAFYANHEISLHTATDWRSGEKYSVIDKSQNRSVNNHLSHWN